MLSPVADLMLIADFMHSRIDAARAERIVAAQREQIRLLVKSGWLPSEAADYVREAALSDER